MRSFLLAPLLAASVSAIAVDLSGRNASPAAAPVEQRGQNGLPARRGPAPARKRLVRRQQCAGADSAVSVTEAATATTTTTTTAAATTTTTTAAPAATETTTQTPALTETTTEEAAGTGAGTSIDNNVLLATTTEAAAGAAQTATGDGSLLPISVARYWSTANNGISMDTALAVTYGSLPAVTSAPDNTQAMVCNYPAGGIGGKSGFSFYSAGNVEGVDVSTAKEVVISYSIWFDSDFEWVKGGKLPGLYGGATADTAKGCSGGSKRDDCFSTRLMWRTDGMGEFYDYVPVSATQAYCSASDSHCNPAYGDSIGRGAWNFTRGAWNTVTMRVKLNDAGSDNGEQQMWLNGKSVLNVSNITFRLSNDVKFQGIMAQTFFGGSTSDYAPSVEQHAWFKDWTLAIIA